MTVSPAEPIRAPATPATARSWTGWLGTLGGAFLGLVLLFAAWAKALDPAAFAQQIHGQKLDFLLPAPTVALLALGLEVGLGVTLLLGVRRLWVLVPAALLVVFFLSLTGRAYWLAAHGVAPDAAGCGCFGNLVQRSPAEAFWQDLLLLVPALALAFVGRAGRDDRGQRAPGPWVRTMAAAVLALAAMAFAWKAPDLPLDDLATRLKPGAEIKGMCAGAGADRVCLDTVAPDLTSGAHLVVLADLTDPGFQKAVAALNAYAGSGPSPAAPAVSVLADVTAEQKQTFFWRWAPAFPIVETPAAILKPLYRRLPRSFVTQDGRVTRTYPGLPPLPPLATASAPPASGPASRP
ncbi:MAG TPA: MauE/DoxX family redox-associated membrane protein [Thermoanaerobaculia bacterium]|nr:MauE/DoxX family redox-associated membrane protein [Thermoanaerobaculia bacterium]